MVVLWVALLVLGIAAVGFGIALWVRASHRYSDRTGEQWGPPSAPAYFLVIGGVMAGGIAGLMLALG
jgi:hypothetical protein